MQACGWVAETQMTTAPSITLLIFLYRIEMRHPDRRAIFCEPQDVPMASLLDSDGCFVLRREEFGKSRRRKQPEPIFDHCRSSPLSPLAGWDLRDDCHDSHELAL